MGGQQHVAAALRIPGLIQARSRIPVDKGFENRAGRPQHSGTAVRQLDTTRLVVEVASITASHGSGLRTCRVDAICRAHVDAAAADEVQIPGTRPQHAKKRKARHQHIAGWQVDTVPRDRAVVAHVARVDRFEGPFLLRIAS